MAKWRRTTKGDPCPVCGDSGWCSLSRSIEGGAEKLYVRCMAEAKGNAPAAAGWKAIKRHDGAGEDGGVVYVPDGQNAPQGPPDPAARAKAERADEADRRRRMEAARALWGEAGPLGGRALEYLRRRGLELRNPGAWPALRHHPAAPYAPSDWAIEAVESRGRSWPREGGRLARMPYPALLAAATDASGERVSGLQRVYLRRKGPAAKIPTPDAKKSKGAMKGASVKLGRPAESGRPLILTEGVETGLACALASGCAVWACVSTAGLRSVELPKGLVPSVVIIAADHDAPTASGENPGGVAAEIAANRLRRRGTPVAVAMPPIPPGVELSREPGRTKSVDWLDLFNRDDFGPGLVRELLLEAAPSGPRPAAGEGGGGPAEPSDRDLCDVDGWRRVVVTREPRDQARKFLRWPSADRPGWTLRSEDGDPLVRRAEERWLAYTGRKYQDLPGEQLEAWISGFLESALLRKGEDRHGAPIIEDAPSSETRVRNLEKALRSLAMASGEFGEKIDLPTWIDARGRATDGPIRPESCIAFRNGLLDVDAWVAGERRLLPHTPRWLSPVCLPFDFPSDVSPGSDDDPEGGVWAKAPAYADFIGRCFREDVDDLRPGSQTDAWHEWLGYCMVPDTSYQTICCLQGDPGTGKGTMLRLLEGLFGGSSQVASTTLRQLSRPFGLQRLLNTLVAVIPDAASDSRQDAAAGAEVLKMISGEDRVGVDRKGIADLPSVKLMARFTIVMNEVVWIPDEAGAFSRRMLWLHTPDRVPADKRDPDLSRKLEAELPYIAAIALDGLARLRGRGRFEQPHGGEGPALEFRERSSPLVGFVRDCCEVGEGLEVAKEELHAVYLQWAEEMQLRRTMPANEFGRRLRTAVPGIEEGREGSGDRRRTYRGIRPLPTLAAAPV